jgi:hypothetical protein
MPKARQRKSAEDFNSFLMVWIEYDCYACTLCRLSVSAADVVCRTTAYLWKVTVVAVRHSDEWMGYSEYVEWNSYSVSLNSMMKAVFVLVIKL